jgi:hypothetical protein
MSTTRPDSPPMNGGNGAAGPDRTKDGHGAHRAGRASRWVTPAFSLVLGLFFFGLAASRDEWGDAWFSLDERAAQIHLRAAAFSFYALVLVLTSGFVITLVNESSLTSTFSGLCAVAGVSIIGSYLVLSRRS